MEKEVVVKVPKEAGDCYIFADRGGMEMFRIIPAEDGAWQVSLSMSDWTHTSQEFWNFINTKFPNTKPKWMTEMDETKKDNNIWYPQPVYAMEVRGGPVPAPLVRQPRGRNRAVHVMPGNGQIPPMPAIQPPQQRQMDNVMVQAENQAMVEAIRRHDRDMQRALEQDQEVLNAWADPPDAQVDF